MNPRPSSWLNRLQTSQRSLKIQLDRWLDRLGNWNPQLLRELKGNCTSRNLTLATLSSLIAQAAFWMNWQRIAVETATVSTETEGILRFYCTGQADEELRACELLSSATFAVNWPLWWLDLFFWLSSILVGLLVLGGTQALITNWLEESKQGTLDFIRMTPEPSHRILWGKLLGAPALIHWAVLLALPLQTLAGLQAGLGLGGLLLADGVAVAFLGALYLLGLFYASVSDSKQAISSWAFGILGLFLFAPALTIARGVMIRGTMDTPVSPSWFWFGQDLILQPQLCAAIAIAGCAGVALTFWQAVIRRFQNPANTFITKVRSYWLTIGFNLLAMGFFMPWNPNHFQGWAVVGCFWLIQMFAWVVLLLPTRQTLLDWARYRHFQRTRDARSSQRAIDDWLWGENSPPLLALLVNGGLTIALWSPWALAFCFNSSTQGLLVLVAIGCTTGLMLLYGALAQWALLWQVRRPVAWAAGLVGAAIIGSLLLGLMMRSRDAIGWTNAWDWVWLMTPVAPMLMGIVSDPLSLSMAGVAFAINGVAAVGVSYVALNQLDRLGRSESAALIQDDRPQV